MPADIVLSQVQVSIMPPAHFSIIMEQRGIIIIFIAGVPGIEVIMFGIPIIGRSIVIIVFGVLVVSGGKSKGRGALSPWTATVQGFSEATRGNRS